MKMKRKTFACALALLFGALSLFGACAPADGPQEGDGPHTHTFAQGWEHDETHHWHSATCGHHDAETKLPHNFNDQGICTDCKFDRGDEPDPDLDTKNYYVVGALSGMPGASWNDLVEGCKFTRQKHKDAEGLTISTLELTLTGGNEFKVVNDGSGTTSASYWDGTEMGYGTIRSGDAVSNFSSGENDNIVYNGSAESIFLVTLHSSQSCAGNYLVIDNYDASHVHIFSDDWEHDATSHWHPATCGHSVTSDPVPHNYDNQLVCRDCGYVSEDSPLHEHSFAASWSRDKESHWHAATCSHITEKKDYGKHVFNDKGVCTTCKYRPSSVGGDNYDTYYEIFVYSYCDSNHDGIGDLKGITSKLGYIADMGYTGIWLTPIHPSHSENHKYSVDDYYDVDETFGTLDDLDELVSTAHGLGIKIILDMVFNHTSRYNEWFTQGVQAFKNGDTSNKYYDYYNFSNTMVNDGYRLYNGVYAEAWFDDNMPDLNLANPDVKEELANVMEFWLIDHDVDGFRLDAAKHYFGPSNAPYHQESAAFIKWINETAKSYKDSAYVVAEVWEGNATIGNYYGWSDSDSFFYFPTSTGGSGDIASAVSTAMGGSGASAASKFYSSMTTAISIASGHIPAPFLDNHDVDRIADKLNRDANKIKFAYGLLSLYTGTTFTYYGDEIGMVGTRTASNTDAERRYAMLWDVSNKPTIQVDRYPNSYVFDGVVQQLKDAASILNYYKACNMMRKNNPALLRGTPSQISNTDGMLIFDKVYNGEKVRVAVNFSNSAKQITGNGTLSDYATLDGSEITQSGNSVTLPAYGIAIFA